MASKDLTPILRDWPYSADRITARKIIGRDSTIKIQLRIELGVLQMEPIGRPDGRRPHGSESLMHYHQARLDRHVIRNGTRLGFFLTPDECRELREEAALYYQRYLALFVLEDYEGVVRDTDRNMRVVDLCTRYALEERDRRMLEQFRPYLLMMNSRARAQLALDADDLRGARVILDTGLEKIREYYEAAGHAEGYQQSNEVDILCELRSKIVRRLPSDPIDDLRHRLLTALAAERYEDAVHLRDELARRTSDREADDAVRQKRG